MKAIVCCIVALAMATPAQARDIMRLGGSGEYEASASGDAWFSTGGKRLVTITPTVSGNPTHRTGDYSIDCDGGYRSGSFVKTVRIRLTGVQARCKARVSFSAWGYDGAPPKRLVVRVVVRVV